MNIFEKDGPATAQSSYAVPRTAIVIATYNQAQYLPEAVASALSNTTTTVVLVSDGCPDEKTDLLLSAYADIYPERLLAIRTPNRGPAAARNAGVRSALLLHPNLEFVFFLDSDNHIEPDTIRRMEDTLDESPDAAWTYPDLRHFGQQNLVWRPPAYSRLRQMFSNQSDTASLIRTSVFTNGHWMDETMRHGLEDWEFFSRLTLAGHIGIPCSDVGVHYRSRILSITSRAKKNFKSVFDLMHKRLLGVHSHARFLELESLDRPRYNIRLEDSDATLTFSYFQEEKFNQQIGLLPDSSTYSINTSGGVMDILHQNRLLPGLLFVMQIWANQCGASSLFLTPSHRDHELALRNLDLDTESVVYSNSPTETSKRLILRVGRSHCSPKQFTDLCSGPLSLHLRSNDFGIPDELNNQNKVENLAQFVSRLPWAAAPGTISISFVVPWLGLGGVDACVVALARELRAQGIRVQLIITDQPKVEIEPSEIALFDSVTFVPLVMTHEERMLTLIGSFACSQVVINAHSALCFETFATYEGRLVQQHCAYLHVFDVAPSGEIVGYPSIAAANLGSIDHFLCISRQLMSTLHALGVPHRMMHLISNCPIVPARERLEPGGESPEPEPAPLRILYAGRLDRQKGIERLCRVIEAADPSKFLFEIRGERGIDPADEDALERIHGKKNVSVGSAIFDRQELAVAYRSNDVLIHLTRWEGVPLAILDAMASGCAVIATDVGAVNEVVVHGNNGFLVSAATEDVAVQEALKLLEILDQDRRELLRIRSAALETARNLLWSQSAERILELVVPDAVG